jgi:hypothetical protein
MTGTAAPDPEEEQQETEETPVHKQTADERRMGDPADEPVVPFQPNPAEAPTSEVENPPQPPPYEVDEEGNIEVQDTEEAREEREEDEEEQLKP